MSERGVAVAARYDRLDELCTTSLQRAFDPDRQLFTRQILDGRWSAIEDHYPTEDLTSTAICLVSLHRAGVDTERLGLVPEASLQALAALARARAYAGGMGLAVWANAVWDGLGLDAFLHQCGTSPNGVLASLPSLTTMETAWLVAGLAHEGVRAPTPRVGSMLRTATQELTARFRPDAGVMTHASRDASPVHRARASIANFADQIYPVQALAFASVALADGEPAVTAKLLAASLVARQGELGQWWWHYHARTGVVARHYAVYSVHQHAMAPMALHALAAASDAHHYDAIARSLDWLDDNELGVSMVDDAAGTIWRSIEDRRGGAARIGRTAAALAGRRATPPPPGALELNRETRPYEWGWCLYAGAIARRRPAAGHLV
jgi:hypothetical protein